MVAHGTVDRRDEAITNRPCTLTIGRVPVCRQRTTRRVLRLWSLAPSTNILAWWAARLALVFGSLGTRGSLSFFCSLGWLLWMLYRPLLVIRCHPSIVSSPVDARSLLSSFFGTFGWLLGVLRALFAHELPPSSCLGLAVQRTTVTMVPPSWSRAERRVESQIRFGRCGSGLEL
jgi:hypothetical protein